MNINWYPGHMKKTLDEMKQKLKLIDFYIEIIDARIPESSKNPLIDEIFKGKKRLVLLNKSDLSDEEENRKWLDRYNSIENTRAVLYNAKKAQSGKMIYNESKILNHELIEKQKKKGIKNQTLRAMVVGIPNSGKSTFINTFVGKKSTKTGNRPGITKTNQWIRIYPGLDLLDTPGVLWPKFESKAVGENLAFIGSIKDEIMDVESLVLRLIVRLVEINPDSFSYRYGISANEIEPIEVLERIAIKRGAILKGNKIDYERAANFLLDDFRNGLLGKFTLEKAGD